MNRHRRSYLARIVTGIVFFVAFFYFSIVAWQKIKSQSDPFADPAPSTVDAPKTSTTNSAAATPSATDTQITPSPVLAPSALISVPFTSQAPFANWDALHEDACEETSLIMVRHFLDQTDLGDAQTVDNEITELINWEQENGYGTSITLTDLAKIALIKYGMHGTVKSATIESIKTEIANGNPIIVGAAGKVLPNPNFRNGGPNYHMLVIIGYNGTDFITNDPGTRNGKNFVYKYDELMNAIHDWNPDNILNGQKNYLVF